MRNRIIIGILTASIGAAMAVSSAYSAHGAPVIPFADPLVDADGRLAIDSAGFSVMVPAGWSARRPESGSSNLAVVALDGDTNVGVVVEWGDAPVASIADLRRAADVYTSVPRSFTVVSDAVTSAATSPVGTVIRVRSTVQVCLILCQGFARIQYWLAIDGKAVVIDYLAGFGEGPVIALDDDPAGLSAMMGSIRLLPGHTAGAV